MKIRLTSVWVDDQDRALKFYTDVLGFEKKTDVSNGPFRWLTVGAAGEADGTQLQLALNNNPAAQAFQKAMFEQGQPAAMFYSDDLETEFEHVQARGGEVVMQPSEVPGSVIARVKDGCGNLIQITQLRWRG